MLIKKIGISMLCIFVLLLSWAAIGTSKSDIERQNELVSQADAYIDDEIYVYAEPLLEEASAIETDETFDVKNKLKMVYLNLGNYSKYESLLDSMSKSYYDSEIFFEAADYYLDKRNYTKALSILKDGYDRTRDESIEKYYESIRYEYTYSYDNYEYLSEIHNGYSIVENSGKQGLVSPTGGMLIPCMYDKVSTYDSGRIIAKLGDEIITVNSKNQRLARLKADADDFSNFNQNRLGVLTENKWKRANSDLDIAQTEYDFLGMASGGYMAACINDNWGVIDLAGEIVAPFEFDGIKMDSLGRCYGQSSIFIKSGEQYYLYNLDNQNVIRSNSYDDVKPFISSYAAVLKNGKWGFIDNEGNEVLSFSCEEADSFGMHLAGVKVDGKWGFINEKGDLVIEAIFDEVRSFYDGFAPVYDRSGWRFIVLNEYK